MLSAPARDRLTGTIWPRAGPWPVGPPGHTSRRSNSRRFPSTSGTTCASTRWAASGCGLHADGGGESAGTASPGRSGTSRRTAGGAARSRYLRRGTALLW